MPAADISDKTRKILWGRSGNQCALCRIELVVAATPTDGESVIGAECHIVSGKQRGPRYDSRFPKDRLDEYENLILLCGSHHKMVDDQVQKFTVAHLKEVKAAHESRVASAITEEIRPPKLRLIRTTDGIPTFLLRITSGRAALEIVGDICAFSSQNDEPESESEAELIANLVQNLSDCGDIYADMEVGYRVKVAFEIGEMIDELEKAGFWVFGGREIQWLKGGDAAPSSWPIGIIRILRSTNKDIIDFDIESLPNSPAKHTMQEQR